MDEKRQQLRNKTYLGGRISFNRQFSTLDCVIRNLSERGAMIQVDHVSTLPDHVELNVAQRGRSFKARIIWRQLGMAGLRFGDAAENVVPIGVARRFRKAQPDAPDLKGFDLD